MRALLSRTREFLFGSIRRTLTVMLLVMLLVPVVTLALTNRYGIQTQLVRRQSDTYAMALEQAAGAAADQLRVEKSLVNMLCGDASIQAQVTFDAMRDADYDGNWIANIETRQVIYRGYLLGGIFRVSLFMDCLNLSFERNGIYESLTPAQREQFDVWQADRNQTSLFLTIASGQAGNSSPYVCLLTKIPSVHRLGVFYGLMQANISTSQLKEIIQGTPASENARLLLVDGSGEIIARAGPTGMSKADALALQSRVSALSGDVDGSGLVRLDWEGRACLAGSRSVEGTDWQLIMLTPYSDVIGIAERANRLLLFAVLAVLLIALPVVRFVSRYITRSFRSLRAGAAAVAGGDYAVTVEHCGSAEVDEVIDSFNFMTRRIKEMMADQYEMGKALKSAELQVLQEQINPHFLYNTLDLLHWQARRAGADDIDGVVRALSDFYKLSLGNGEEIVSLEHELRHVQAYVRIQNVRFMDRIRLEIDVPEELRNCRIAKITLQPLVENAIQHGIREREDEMGTIRISARRSGGEIVLSVSDDGVGMDEGTREAILSPERRGHGVCNVNDRLILHFGGYAALNYTSEPGVGTTVTIRLPAV